mmetsp:Transcript_21294/g.61521  ORF Transcript_21294/g.61521 Transcript_21294/m.61521 type:complete len:206 (+) Transcript_21294:989-1606(+)
MVHGAGLDGGRSCGWVADAGDGDPGRRALGPSGCPELTRGRAFELPAGSVLVPRQDRAERGCVAGSLRVPGPEGGPCGCWTRRRALRPRHRSHFPGGGLSAARCSPGGVGGPCVGLRVDGAILAWSDRAANVRAEPAAVAASGLRGVAAAAAVEPVRLRLRRVAPRGAGSSVRLFVGYPATAPPRRIHWFHRGVCQPVVGQGLSN